MSWAAVAGAAVGVVGSQLGNKDKNGGAGTTTTSKEPWEAADPWLRQQIAQGQELQNQYTANPFSEQQKQAYANSYALSDKMRGLVPGLLEQMQAQPGGFDRNNPTAKPTSTWDWGAIGSMGGGSGSGSGGGSMTAAAQRQAEADAAAKAAASKQQAASWNWDGDFHQQGDVLSGLNFKDHASDGRSLQGEGGFGSFRYGMNAPAAGTTAYRDMQEYFLRGGGDPNNMYGRGKTPWSFADLQAGTSSGGGGSSSGGVGGGDY